MKKTYEKPIKTYEEILELWAGEKTLDARSRLKMYRTISYDIESAYAKNKYTVKELEQLIKILAKTKWLPNLHTKLITEWLDKTGAGTPKIISKKNGDDRFLNYPDFALVDLSRAQEVLAYLQTNKSPNDRYFIDPLMEKGVLYYYATEGTIPSIQLRVVDGPEPVLTKKEFKFVAEAGEPSYLHIPSGTLFLGSIYDFDKTEEEGMIQKVEPGWYKLRVYEFVIPYKFESYYIVLCKTNEQPAG